MLYIEYIMIYSRKILKNIKKIHCSRENFAISSHVVIKLHVILRAI